MIFRHLYDATSSTYTYILACQTTHDAVIIDPVYEQFTRDTALLNELGLRLKYVLDTHVHADHVTAAWRLKQTLGARIGVGAACGVVEADEALHHGDVISFGQSALEVRATPGHTRGCITFLTRDHQLAFTGDCLLIRGAGRTDFQGGDVHAMWRSIREQIFSLPDDCLLYPGHDYSGRIVSTVGEERRFNPRIGGDAREEDFVGYMRNLGLPHPKLLDIAVPANLHAGRPTFDANTPEPEWGPVIITFAGVPEVETEWVARHLDDITLVDVRSAKEFSGDLGHIRTALLIPLDELRDRWREIPQDKPVVTLCQSGRRSAMALQILRGNGISRVANASGGMLAWLRGDLPHVVR
jgi:glyoxylase-like metal-dependent hydrolase (beta-lactamase superfamily II)/rhodanese-related sulfurtransferase